MWRKPARELNPSIFQEDVFIRLKKSSLRQNVEKLPKSPSVASVDSIDMEKTLAQRLTIVKVKKIP